MRSRDAASIPAPAPIASRGALGSSRERTTRFALGLCSALASGCVGAAPAPRTGATAANELRDYAHRQWENNELRGRAVVEAHTKIRHILAKVASILDDARAAGRPLDAVEAVRVEIESIQHEMLEAL